MITVIHGKLVKDPVLHKVGEKAKVASFVVAYDLNKKESVYVPVKAWNKYATICDKYLSKGSEVIIQGYLRNETYQDGNVKRTKLIVTLEKIKFIAKCQTKSGIDTKTMKEVEKEQKKEEFYF